MRSNFNFPKFMLKSVWECIWGTETRFQKISLLQRYKVGVALSWWRSRMGRPLSSPQIHQKIIWMLSNFHETTSECWQRTAHSLWKEVGQNIKDKKRDKRVRDRDPFQGGSCEGDFQIPGNPLTSGSVGSFRISEGNITGRKQTNKQKTTKKNNNPQNTHLTTTTSGKVAQMLVSTTSKWRLNREEPVTCLR